MLTRTQVGRSRLHSMPGNNLGLETAADAEGSIASAGVSSFAGVSMQGIPRKAPLASGLHRPSSATSRGRAGIPPALVEQVREGVAATVPARSCMLNPPHPTNSDFAPLATAYD
jgi:hypothetical protein